MRLRSVRYIVVEARISFMRFPFVLLAAVAAAVCALVVVDRNDADSWIKGIFAAQLGIPLFFALATAGETLAWSQARRVALALAGIVALVAYYLSLSRPLSEITVIRFVQFNVGLHLLVAFLPYLGAGVNGFWQYNKSLFLRFLTAAIYSGVIYLGLTVALAAIDKLFGVSIEEETYLRLWILVAFVFNTWVFVGGVRGDLRGLEEVRDYPRGLKVFAQYILIPLVVVYLTILTIYLFKVVITTQWPSGWIGYLVSSVAAVGILALLLVHPVSNQEENRWVATFSRWFYIFIIPSIVMLLMAIYKRIDQYGVTEKRYILLVLAAWLAMIAVYFIFSRKKNIKAIPITLCAIAFVTSFGPWGAYSVSRRSQTNRLSELLLQNEVLVAGSVQMTTREVSFEDRTEISAILRYLVETHGTESLERWFGGSIAEIDTIGAPETASVPTQTNARVQLIMQEMGVAYVDGGAAQQRGYFSYTLDANDRVFVVGGATYLVKIHSQARSLEFGDEYTLVWEKDVPDIELLRGGEVVLTVPTDRLFEQIDIHRQGVIDVTQMPKDVMNITAENETARVDVYFNSISGQMSPEGRDVNNFAADCFVSIK
jgi:hypothetical protein